MATLYLIRHGRAAAAWDVDHDPGLDDLGREQAERMAQTIAPRGPLNFLASPMRRTRETAAPLARIWGVEPRIEPRVSEIPSPTADLQARGQWLREIATQSWRTLDDSLQHWRTELLAALSELDRDTVVVTHYIAINLAAGAAIGNDTVVHFRPDYCSVTELSNTGGKLHLVRYGAEANTKVL